MNRPLVVAEFKCQECGQAFPSEAERSKHFHIVQKVSEDVFVVLLPPGVEQGSWAAAEALAKGVTELKERCPDKKFSFVCFEEQGKKSDQYGTNYSGGTISLLAIAN